MASLFRPTFRCKSTGQVKRVKKWYAKVRQADGTVRKVPLSTNKAAAEMMLGQLLTRIEHEKAGIIDPFEAHRALPIGEHLAAWEKHLRAKDSTQKHVRTKLAAAGRVIDCCQFKKLTDLSASRVEEFLTELRAPVETAQLPDGKEWFTKAELAALLGVKREAVTPLVRRHRLAAAGNGKARRYRRVTAVALVSARSAGLSVRSVNYHLDAVKQFAAWAVRDRRLGENPLDHLTGGNPEHDRRVEYAILSADEIRRLIAAASTSAAEFRGLTGRDRASLYALATVTAFRPVELSRLTVADFQLSGPIPLVRLDGTRTKNGKAVEQPIPADVAAEMAKYLNGRSASAVAWPGTWAERAADLIRVDLPTAGLPFAKSGSDGRELMVSFYSLRHSAGVLAEEGGATLREVMTLMRHSDPKLTLRTYGRLQLGHLSRAVGNMPSVLPAGDESLASGLPQFGPELGQAGDGGEEVVMANEDGNSHGGRLNTLENQGDEGTCGTVMAGEVSNPGETRTRNRPLRRRLLYPVELRGRRRSIYPSNGLRARTAYSGPVRRSSLEYTSTSSTAVVPPSQCSRFGNSAARRWLSSSAFARPRVKCGV
jgi:integrase